MNNTSFTSEFWNWLRHQRKDRPDPKDFGLSPEFAAIIEHFCQSEFDRMWDGKLKEWRMGQDTPVNSEWVENWKP